MDYETCDETVAELLLEVAKSYRHVIVEWSHDFNSLGVGLAIIHPGPQTSSSKLQTGEGAETFGYGFAVVEFVAHDEDGVVSGYGANDFVEAGAV
jgi:hypothetical protein